MDDYNTNKGVGQSVEFKGLKSQYLITFFAIIGSSFIVFTILSSVGIPSIIIIPVVGIYILVGMYYVFTFNKKYGPDGFTKLSASKRSPRMISSRKKIKNILRCNSKYSPQAL